MRMGMTRVRWLAVPVVLGLLLGLTATGAQAAGRTAVAISASKGHSCALASDHTVWCWGDDTDGQLGDGPVVNGTTQLQLVPVPVVVASGKLGGVKAITTGYLHSCALLTGGTVLCWGSDQSGQLGDGTTGEGTWSTRVVPVAVRNGTDTGKLTHVTSISASQYHTCAVRKDHTAWCWGYDASGELGDGLRGDAVLHLHPLPVQVRNGSHALSGVTAISAGVNFTCARRSDATAWCWGSDFQGNLGDGTTGHAGDHDRLRPVQVRSASGPLTNVKAISSGEGGACALRTDGSAWCWGDAYNGQIGDGHRGDATNSRLKAVRVHQGHGLFTAATAITTGSAHSCALRSDHTAWCWGYDAYGELGDGTTGHGGLRLLPVQVHKGSGKMTHVKAIDAGTVHTCALRTDSTVWCWGADYLGQLGDGTTGDSHQRRLLPVKVGFIW